MKTITLLQRVIISRTDSIGDVCLTLPICKALKEKFPAIHLIFLGKTYTQAVIEACPYVDEFLDFSALERMNESVAVEKIRALHADALVHVFPNKKVAKWAKKAKIHNRIGTSHRFFHWLTCNVRLNFTRKNSDLHESQLNFELLKPFGIDVPPFEAIKAWELLEAKEKLPRELTAHFSSHRKVILHCKSQGSALEWGFPNFMSLAIELAEQNIQVFFTGTEAEGAMFRPYLPKHELILDVSGQMSLAELLTFIKSCDVLVAASTGPLHLAGLLGTKAIGLFSSRRPIHPGRWQALGENSLALVNDENCLKCKKGEACSCIEFISVEDVFQCCS